MCVTCKHKTHYLVLQSNAKTFWKILSLMQACLHRKRFKSFLFSLRIGFPLVIEKMWNIMHNAFLLSTPTWQEKNSTIRAQPTLRQAIIGQNNENLIWIVVLCVWLMSVGIPCHSMFLKSNVSDSMWNFYIKDFITLQIIARNHFTTALRNWDFETESLILVQIEHFDSNSLN